MSEEEMLPFVEVLRESGIVEQINGGQEWEPDLTTRRRASRTTSIQAVWDKPVSHSGPWSWHECRGKRKVSFKQSWTEITGIEAVVNLDTRTVETYSVNVWGPVEPKIGIMNPFVLVRVYDRETGKRLITGPLLFIMPGPILCPPGWSYDRD